MRLRRLWHIVFGCPQAEVETYPAGIGMASRADLHYCRRCGHRWWVWVDQWPSDAEEALARIQRYEDEIIGVRRTHE